MTDKRTKWVCALGILAGLGSLATPGCSDDSGAIDAAPGDSVAVDAGQDGDGGKRQTFSVAERTDSATPLQGATVALDPPGGGPRVEKKTGADGKVTFEGIDWGRGDATVTAHLDGYAMESFIDLNPARITALPARRTDGEALKILLLPLSPQAPESVTVSGSVKGLKDPTHAVAVNVQRSKVKSEWQGASTATFTVTAPKGEPFVLQGIELEESKLPSGQGYQLTIHRVMHQDFAAVTQDTTGVELDFAAHEVSTQTADATVALPTRSDSPLRAGSPACWVFNSESSSSNGWAKQVEVQPAQDQLAVSFIWTAPTWAKELQTRCQVYNSATGDLATLSDMGYPKAGAMKEPLLDVPKWVTPASAATAHPLFTKMEWQLSDKGVHAGAEIFKGKQIVWMVLMGLDDTSLVLPKPPSSVNKAVFFGPGNLSGALFVEKFDSADPSYYRASLSQARLIKP